MNPARGKPLEQHFYFCHSVCRQPADRQFTIAIRGTPPSHRFALRSSDLLLSNLQKWRTQRGEILSFPVREDRGRSYQFHKTGVALNGRDAQKANGLFQVYVVSAKVTIMREWRDSREIFCLRLGRKRERERERDI